MVTPPRALANAAVDFKYVSLATSSALAMHVVSPASSSHAFKAMIVDESLTLTVSFALQLPVPLFANGNTAFHILSNSIAFGVRMAFLYPCTISGYDVINDKASASITRGKFRFLPSLITQAIVKRHSVSLPRPGPITREWSRGISSMMCFILILMD
jgi:hypothetical protein